MKGKEVVKALEAVFDACGIIQEGGACGSCPLRSNCLDEATFSQVCDMVTIGEFDEMLGLAEDIDNYMNEDSHWDTVRKSSAEERMIDMAWGL